jgi:hypothetical protein
LARSHAPILCVIDGLSSEIQRVLRRGLGWPRVVSTVVVF